MMLWIGIDPGKKGGVSSIDAKGNLEVFPMFATMNQLHEYLCNPNIRHVALERCQAMPGQGVSSMFNYGMSYGVIQGILIANGLSHTLVPPKQWQKVMFQGVSDKDGKRKPKDKALEAANRVFAKKSCFWLPSKRCIKPHDGMIDSALIAEYCRRAIK